MLQTQIGPVYLIPPLDL